jgi:uncharacterized membrane protein YhaH (DUF805 family)
MNLVHELIPSGRIDRAGFWWRHCITVPLALWAANALGGANDALLGTALALLTTALLVSVWGRRLHDRGHSAWWLLAASIPVIGPLGLLVECGLRRSREADHGRNPNAHETPPR